MKKFFEFIIKILFSLFKKEQKSIVNDIIIVEKKEPVESIKEEEEEEEDSTDIMLKEIIEKNTIEKTEPIKDPVITTVTKEEIKEKPVVKQTETQTKLDSSKDLSNHVTITEFIKSPYAIRNGINNNFATEKEKQNAIKLCTIFADTIRDYYNKPIIITSGYRCPKVNSAVGGSSTSEHKNGNAMDFNISGVDLKTVFNDIAEGRIKFKENFDQLIWEYGSWIHLGRRDKPRKQILAIYNSKQGYISIKKV